MDRQDKYKNDNTFASGHSIFYICIVRSTDSSVYVCSRICSGIIFCNNRIYCIKDYASQKKFIICNNAFAYEFAAVFKCKL